MANTKRNVIRYINEETAQVTKAFEKKACIYGTDEFKLWREYKKEFPKAKMQTKSINKNPDQKNRRNMTYPNMEAYIKTQPNRDELLNEYKTIKERSKIQTSPYQYVLNWFEGKFDGYNDLEQFMAKKEEERSGKNTTAGTTAIETEND